MSKIETDQNFNWASFLDSYSLISGQLNLLLKTIKSEKTPQLSRYIVVPRILTMDKDDVLSGITENRVDALRHDLVSNHGQQSILAFPIQIEYIDINADIHGRKSVFLNIVEFSLRSPTTSEQNQILLLKIVIQVMNRSATTCRHKRPLSKCCTFWTRLQRILQESFLEKKMKWTRECPTRSKFKTGELEFINSVLSFGIRFSFDIPGSKNEDTFYLINAVTNGTNLRPEPMSLPVYHQQVLQLIRLYLLTFVQWQFFQVPIQPPHPHLMAQLQRKAPSTVKTNIRAGAQVHPYQK